MNRRMLQNSSLRGFALAALLCFITLRAGSQVIYNAYAMATAISGRTLLTVSSVNETSHTFTAGEQVIVMQMQDDVIGSNTANTTGFGALSGIANAGVFEVMTMSVVNRSAGTPTSISLTSSLVNTYNTGANSRVQIISFRRLNAAAFTTTASITGAAWNGSVGGVIALNVGTDFTISHSITANDLGFRGGSRSVDYYGGGTTCTTNTYAASSASLGYKGEGIFAITSATQTNGIAKIVNGGGGGGIDINGGGGGGGNFTAGGTGGPGWDGSAGGCSPSAGGQAGVTLSASIGPSRVFMGGGGGGAQQNNNIGSSGANGGGIILIRANRIITGGCSFNPTITASGGSAANAGNDGAGGGGAGGSIVLDVNTYSVSAACPLRIMANGGNGGNVTDATTHAGGGAGGQGAVIYSVAQPTVNITTQTNNGTGGCNQSGCSNSAGSAGGVSSGGIIPASRGILPIELLYFIAKSSGNIVELSWSTASEKNTDHFLVKRSTDGIHWSTVDKVNAHGYSKTTLFYKGFDLNPPAGTVYYMLTSVDLDLSQQNSPVQAIERNGEEAVMVLYPNPARNNLSVMLSQNTESVKITLLNTLGCEVNAPLIEMLDKKVVIDISQLTPGVYYVQASFGGKPAVSKLIIN